MRSLIVCAVLVATLTATPSASGHDHPTMAPSVSRSPAPSSIVVEGVDQKALAEILRGRSGRMVHWSRPPKLVVLTSVMQYRLGPGTEYSATSETLADEEADSLIADLTEALSVLTGGAFTRFAEVDREGVSPGSMASVIRKGQIVVGRYRGIQDAAHTIGLGGRVSAHDDTISSAAVFLDSDYDRTNSLRRLLRTHELGHALGYNHVESHRSIMNPRIGPEPTELDRRAARIAFAGVLGSLD
jgi:hypothetical protein